jgi:hypothetical protein
MIILMISWTFIAVLGRVVYDCSMGTAKKPAGSKRKQPHSKKSTPSANRLTPKTLLLAYGGLIILTGITAVVIATAQEPPLTDPFRTEQRTTVAFILYYPVRLPEGLSVDAASLSRTESNVIAMRITDGRGSQGQSFTISQQALPPGFNLDTFYVSFSDKTTFKTDLGTATAGTIDNGANRLVSLVTPANTWILVQAPAATPMEDVEFTLKHLKASQAAN